MNAVAKLPNVRVPPAMLPAAAASLLIHIAIAGVLAAFVSLRPFAWGYSNAKLTVDLVAPLRTAEAPLTPAVMVVPDAANVPASTTSPPQALANQPQPSAPQVPSPAMVEPSPPRDASQAALTLGQIRVATNYEGLSGLPEALVLRSQSEFLIEVDKLARVARDPDVAYPLDALQAKREGTVVAWLALDREGAVTETIIVSGEPEFAAAVEAALPTARFLPAENGGQTVPYYMIMTFAFRGG